MEEEPKKEDKTEEGDKKSEKKMDVETKTDDKTETAKEILDKKFKDKKIEVEEPKPKTKMVKKKRTDYHNLKVDDLVTYRFSKEEFDKYFEIESTMNNEDILILATLHAKNDLEALCYKYQEKLDEYGGELKAYMPVEELPTVKGML